MISTHWQLGMAKVPIGASGEEWQAPNTALHTKEAAVTWAAKEKESVFSNSKGKQCQAKRKFRAEIPSRLFYKPKKPNEV